ncbi:MAG: twin-arginine translocase TatA/TatE family subunit [Dehalococcoidia bacterium]|nr:twin-arginine translocase TatA/TatE family subunit [Dehalococcoidia bacterium]
MPFLIFQQLGPFEIILIVLAILLVFGVGKVADLGGALGRSIREFRRELKEGQEEEQKVEATKVEGKSEEEKKS